MRDARLVGGERPFLAAGKAEGAARGSGRAGHRRAQRVAEAGRAVDLEPARGGVVLLGEAETLERGALREPVRG